MDDIISNGPQGEPSRLIRPAAAALILTVLIVLAVVAVGRLSRNHVAVLPSDHAGRCHYVQPGNHDFQLTSLAGCR